MQPDRGPRPLILSSAAVLMLSVAALIGSLLLPALRHDGLPAAFAAANGVAEITANTSPDCPIFHKVQSGETLSIIARTHSLTVSDLVQANAITNLNLIHVGQILCLPAIAAQNGEQPSRVGQTEGDSPPAPTGSDICVQGRVVDELYRGLAGFTITASAGSTVSLQTVTNSDGSFVFDGLAPGIWTFSEEQTRGWEAITPAEFIQPLNYGYDGCYQVRFQNREVRIPACLLVSKADELDGAPLEGWEIQVRPFAGGAWLLGTTDASGQVHFANLDPGRWEVREVARYPWTAASPASGQQEVILHPMADEQDCGKIQFRNRKLPTGCIEGSKIDEDHAGLPDRTVCARPSGLSEPVICTTTDADGLFRIDELTLGEWTVWEVLEPGWTAVTASEFPVPVLEGDICQQVRFKNRAPDLCLTGFKLDDLGFGLSNWAIRAWPKGQPDEAIETVTRTDGSYRFCGLTLGTWVFEELRQTGWRPLASEQQEMEVVFPGRGFEVDGPIFRNARPLGCIEGWSLDDLEVGLPLWSVTVQNMGSSQTWSAKTNGTGYFKICHLPLGDYQVSQEVQIGWKPLSPTRVDVSLVAADDEMIVTAAFINTQAPRDYCIDGYLRDVADHAGLPGWEIRLFDSSGQGLAASTTDGTGYFHFTELNPGVFWLQQPNKDGWTAMTPGSVSVSLAYPPSHQCQRADFVVGRGVTTAPGCATWHTVRYGETLAIVSRKYGVPLPSLLAANQLANPDRIWPGQQICIAK